MGFVDRKVPDRDRDYPRVCDFCGVRWMAKELKMIEPMRFACPDCSPGMTALQISKYNARVRPLIVRPRKWAKDYIQTPIYQLAEAQAFNFIAKNAPADTPGGGSLVATAAWAAIYMADVILDARRPLTWDRTARTVLARCCDFLLTKQYTANSLSLKYGAINDSGTTWTASVAIAAGVAFAKAYTALGTANYLLAAERCATFLRRAHRADLHSTAYTVFPSGSSARYRIKGIPSLYLESTDRYDDPYLVDDLLAMWLFKLLGDIRGQSTVYGGAPTSFNSSADGTIATILAELQEFADVGVADATTGGLVSAISPTAPKSSYSAAFFGFGGTTRWTILGVPGELALALRGLYEASGATSQVTSMVSACFLGIAANPAFATPAGMTEAALYAGLTGDFDATLCPPVGADYSVTPFLDSSSSYDWASLGILSPIMDAATLGNLRTSKDTLSTGQKTAVEQIDRTYIVNYGYTGLTFQTSLQALSVKLAAQAAGIYRAAPGRYPDLRGT